MNKATAMGNGRTVPDVFSVMLLTEEEVVSPRCPSKLAIILPEDSCQHVSLEVRGQPLSGARRIGLAAASEGFCADGSGFLYEVTDSGQGPTAIIITQDDHLRRILHDIEREQVRKLHCSLAIQKLNHKRKNVIQEIFSYRQEYAGGQAQWDELARKKPLAVGEELQIIARNQGRIELTMCDYQEKIYELESELKNICADIIILTAKLSDRKSD